MGFYKGSKIESVLGKVGSASKTDGTDLVNK